MKVSIIYQPDSMISKFNPPFQMVEKYKNNTFFTRLLRKFFSNKKFVQPFINNPKIKNLDSDVIIIFDSVSLEFIKWVKKHNQDKRLILWYWNPVTLTHNPSLIPDGIEKWSYSITDCEKYNLKYNTQFCMDKYKDFKVDVKSEYDVIFVGRDKGRSSFLRDFEIKINNLGLKTNFIIIQTEKQFIPYDKLIELTQKSKCIFDLCAFDDAGLSLRALEALHMEKKVITNNTSYLKEPFYKKENVFILGKDNLSTLNEFINSPYEKVDEDIKNYYFFDNWANRFLEE